MNQEAFLKAYNESRNGTNGYTRHMLTPKLVYSDGVKECAEAGGYWLLDLVGTEVAPLALKSYDLGLIYVVVRQNEANIRLEFDDDVIAWRKNIRYTDLPDGNFTFAIQNNDGVAVMILMSEY